MIPTLQVNEYLSDAILVSRESAQELYEPLRALLEQTCQTGNSGESSAVKIDFAGIAGISPSFVDELVRVFEAVVEVNGKDVMSELHIANPPSRLSSKFEAIARGHGLSIRMRDDGSWCIGIAGGNAG